MKAIGIVWFTGRDTIGIVIGYNEISKRKKAYIAKVLGNSESEDVRHILDYGTKFPTKEAVALIEKQGTIKVTKKEWVRIIHIEENDGN